ncbi:MAG TPA: Holliday junction branch migration protein RuvA [Flavobacteriales bacterium]|jgi:Holliday junction DNA helicase RuvA|nr:Holliday junction branch migration protein RuvA [Flavobacteriales bacterium]HNK85110.1 Holliday junction branch migration protein RuvA [Flavobacteriales bacterium]HNO03703.1 Holliday junction branch migration protein RuvA [Flavobacteriales bacterium]
MIDSLRGEIAEKAPGHVVVECHGVGYLVLVTANTLAGLPAQGPCKLFIHYAVSVDVRSGQSEHKLFGFISTEERHMFRQLIGVQGVSATLGLAILGARQTDELRVAILNGEEHMLKAVKGIGPKLAQRIVTELRGKLADEPVQQVLAVAGGGGNTLRAEALSALVSLGLDRARAERALQKSLAEREGDTPPLEELIRTALKNL